MKQNHIWKWVFIGGLAASFSQPSAKSSLAFLGISSETEPLQKEELAHNIHWSLASDTNFFSQPEAEIMAANAKGWWSDVEVDALHAKGITTALNVQYLLFAHLNSVSIETKRVFWMPWVLKVTWKQALQIRMRDVTGQLKLDSTIIVDTLYKENTISSYPRLAELSPLLRDERKSVLLKLLSVKASTVIRKKLLDLNAPVVKKK